MLARNILRNVSLSQHFSARTFSKLVKSDDEDKVYTVFEDAAAKYDKLNDSILFVAHRIWRRKFIDRINITDNTRILDSATGTGMMGERLLRIVQRKKLKNCHVTLCDINEPMLQIAKKKMEQFDASWSTCLTADGENLPFQDGSFDKYTISYGMRCCGDVHNMRNMLREAHRVVKPGGEFLCLEFSKPNGVIKWLLETHLTHVAPMIARTMGLQSITQYLKEGVERFPDQETFKKMIEDAGFRNVKYENIMFGICCIHTGLK